MLTMKEFMSLAETYKKKELYPNKFKVYAERKRLYFKAVDPHGVEWNFYWRGGELRVTFITMGGNEVEFADPVEDLEAFLQEFFPEN